MRVDKVNQSKKVGVIKFNSDTEANLIEESMNRLIEKQKRLAEKTDYKDNEEVEKLERYKKSKQMAVDMPKMERQQTRKQNDKLESKFKTQKGIARDEEAIDFEKDEEFKRVQRMRLEGEGEKLTGNVEITHKNLYDIVNAINDHIYELEKDKTYAHRNKDKYHKLQGLLTQAQEQKAKFERLPPKPTKWGRLRK